MVSLRKSAVAAAGLAPLVAVHSLATPSPTGAQQGGETPRPQDVTVVNTPLPVTGAVDVRTVPPLSGRRVVIEAISTLPWAGRLSFDSAGGCLLHATGDSRPFRARRRQCTDPHLP